MKKRTIIYISGEGHSGTTLLDIVLGAQENIFSSGELCFFAQKGIINKEYCACGKIVPDCEIWSQIIDKWDAERKLALKDYINIQSKLTSKKNILSSYRLLKNPSEKVSYFLKDTRKLYDIIFEVTDSHTIVDSSKAPARMLILKKLGYDIEVVHLTRRFGDVLNSYKKKVQKNLEEGVEYDIKPLKSSYVFSSWVVKNLFTYLFSKDTSYKRVKYENLVANPDNELSTVININGSFLDKLRERGPFYPKHLVAGNRIRMKDSLYIAKKPLNTSYQRLNRRDKIFARLMDFFY